MKQAQADPARFSINGLGYLLVEVPDYGLPPGLTETFYELQLAGLTPILTHPERNPTLQKEPERMKDWLRGGVLIQVTADSLTGHKGKQAERMALDLLETALGPLPGHRRAQHHLAAAANARGARSGGQQVRRELRARAVRHQSAGCLSGQAVRGGRGAARTDGRGEGTELVAARDGGADEK